MKLFILLYADDTVILAESSDDMQNQINYSMISVRNGD